MNSDNNNKTTGGLGSDLKALDPKTNAPAATATDQPGAPAAVREGTPQPGIQAPGAGAGVAAGLPPHPLTADMRRQWSKFVDGDLKNIKTRDDLSVAVQAKYGITADQAARQVKDWAVGRQF